MELGRLTMMLALILLTGCSSATLRVSGYAPIAGWLAEKSIAFHRDYLCAGELEREERYAKTYTQDAFTSIDVQYNCYR